MASAVQLLTGLRDALAGTYPTRIADQANRPGTVTAVVLPDRVEYEPVMCDPQPMLLTATVMLLAATGGETGTTDLIGHTGTVAGLIRAAGFTPTGWSPAQVEDQPAIEFTCTANGTG